MANSVVITGEAIVVGDTSEAGRLPRA